MKKEKIQLTEEDLKLGPTGLQKKYGISSRGHAGYILKKGYFWKNYLQVEESLSPEWVEENLEKIKQAVKQAVWFKAGQKGILSHHLFKFFKEDLEQEGFLYVIKRAGEIQSRKSKLINIADTGVDHAIIKYFRYGDGANTVNKFDFLDDQSLKASSFEEDNEMSIDELFSQVQEEVISSFGEKVWAKIWSWASSRKGRCPEDVSQILKAIAL